MNTQELKGGLANFYGTENYHFNPLYSWLKYTDGVKFFAENAGGGAYWFLDIVGTELKELSRKEEFILIRLQADSRHQGFIEATDGNENVLYTKVLDLTDCPEGEWKFYLTSSVLMLPSEY